MPTYQALCDITNTRQSLSKDFGQEIKRGEVLEYEKAPERVKQLVKVGVLKEIEDAGQSEDESAGSNDQDPASLQLTDDEPLPDDREKLKVIADGMGIDYAANIGAAKLKEKILAKREK